MAFEPPEGTVEKSAGRRLESKIGQGFVTAGYCDFEHVKSRDLYAVVHSTEDFEGKKWRILVNGYRTEEAAGQGLSF